MRGKLAAATVVAVSVMLACSASPAGAFELYHSGNQLSLISPSVTAEPVEVVLWVRDTVTPANEAWITDEIRQGLDRWENVPTSNIRFRITAIRSATEPPIQPGQLMVTVANSADLTGGGASFPGNGNPGRWFGAPADLAPQYRDRFDIPAAHEIGHAIGFWHSTISDAYFGINNIPIMHWASAPVDGITEEDVAAVSVAYPDASNPLSAVTGRLHGRVVAQDNPLPVDGVNVVAVNTATGKPTVSRVTGADIQKGRFDLPGLPPASYNLLLLDGTSTRGTSLGLAGPQFQNGNFTDATLGPYTVSAGSVQDLGDRPIAIEPLRTNNMRVQGQNLGDRTWLPTIVANQPYEALLHLDGGVRPFDLTSTTGLPAGVNAAIYDNQQSNGDHPGDTMIRLSGTPTEGGDFAPSFDLEDDHGTDTTLALSLRPAIAKVTGSVLSYDVVPGQANNVTVSYSDGTYTITDSGVDQISPGNRCQATGDPKTVTCSSSLPSIFSVQVDVKDLDDRVTVDTPSAAASVTGGDGNDILTGGEQTDTFDGGAGNDLLNGGAGFDTASYATRTGAVRADIDGVADDGQSGERDNIALDVENIDGGSGNDRLIGSTASNTINGNGGADRIYGYRSGSSKSGDAGDLLVGGGGDDRLYGQAGGDQLFGDDLDFGATGNDRLYGGYGNDYIEGGFGQNGIYGQGNDDFVFSIASGFDNIKTSSGDDTVIADDGDGEDRISCSAGLDSFRADPSEPALSCELTAE